MGLSCSCGDFDIEPGTWYWEDNSSLKPMDRRARRVKCCSCKKIINDDDLVVEFYRYMPLDEDSITYKIHGEARQLASWYECEECTDLREALEELGYCVNLGEYMKDLIAEHNEIRNNK